MTRARACRLAAVSIAIAAATAAHGRETVRLQPQNAGAAVHVAEDFVIHLPVNQVPSDVRYSGPMHCRDSVRESDGRRRRARLVVIADKGKAFDFTRSWLWDNLRGPVLETLSETCPGAESVHFSLYIRGYDMVASGDVCRTEEVELPLVRRPPPFEPRGKDGDVALGFAYVPGLVFNIGLEDFVSKGIVSGTFVSSGACGSPEVPSCERESFFPRYHAFWTPSEDYLVQLARAGSSEAREDLEGVYEKAESRANFSSQAAARSTKVKDHAPGDGRRARHDRRTEYYAQFWSGIDDMLEERGFWELLVAGFSSEGDCDDADPPECRPDRSVRQNAPLVFE